MVLAIVGALWALLLSRLEDTSRLAQGAQLKMAIEQVNLQERLLQLRCGAALMPDCWRQWLSERMAVPGEPDRPEPPMPPMLPLAPDAASRLQVLALAAGLYQAPQRNVPIWQLLSLPGPKLQVALHARPMCRFVVEALPEGSAQARLLSDC